MCGPLNVRLQGKPLAPTFIWLHKNKRVVPVGYARGVIATLSHVTDREEAEVNSFE
jgi:hypothetical protein